MNIRGGVMATVCVVSCLVVTGRAEAQAPMVLEIPGVQGQSTTPGFANQIDVLSVSWGVARPCGTGISVSDVSIMKNSDRASVDLLAALRDQTVYPTATLRMLRTDNQVYQIYVMTNMVLTSHQTSGSSGAAPSTESISATFSQLTVTHTYFDGSGKPSGTESTTIVSPACP